MKLKIDYDLDFDLMMQVAAECTQTMISCLEQDLTYRLIDGEDDGTPTFHKDKNRDIAEIESYIAALQKSLLIFTVQSFSELGTLLDAEKDVECLDHEADIK